MKKVLFFTTVLFAGLLNAQDDTNDRLTIEKGTWNLTTNFSLRFEDNSSSTLTSSNSSDFTSFSIAPSVGYAFRKNTLAGLGVGYSFRKTEGNSEVEGQPLQERESKGRTFFINPFLRQYFGIGKSFALYLQAEGSYRRFKDELEIPASPEQDSEVTGNGFSLGIRPGLTYFVSKKFAFEATVGFLGYQKNSSERNESDIENDSESFRFDLDSSNLFLGLAYYF